MLARYVLSMLLVLTVPAIAQDAGPAVAVKRVDVSGEQVFEVVASGTVKAPPGEVWKVLTDYEKMPEFVPDLDVAKVLSRNGNKVVLQQAGVARFLFLRRDIRLVVHISEEPTSSIDINLVSGDMKAYSCRWEITALPDGAGSRIDYSGKLVPKFYVPGMLGSNLIKRDIERMMAAVLKRIDGP